MPNRRAVALLALTSGIFYLTSCTYISLAKYEEEKAQLDHDGDGCPFGGPVPDCDDFNPNECQNFEEVAYDGFDNDCDKTIGDLIDVDGDKFAPFTQEEYFEKFPDADPWKADIRTDAVDCYDVDDEYGPDVNPNGKAKLYDGLDNDCSGGNDFDADDDGYMPPKKDKIKGTGGPADGLTYEEAFEQYVEMFDLKQLSKNAAYGDCFDDANAGAGSHPGNSADDDVWYDGHDADCAGNNDFDQDGDGFIPEGYETDYEKFIGDYHDDDPPWGFIDPRGGPFDCLDAEDATNFAGVNPGTVYPEAPDTAYDGVNSDCDPSRDDFDFDADLYTDVATDPVAYADYVASYAVMFPDDTLPVTLEGDCNDADETVFPGTTEFYGDAVDQDCDGGANTTPFGFGGLMWTNPRRPMVRATSDHYVLSTAADWLDKGPSTQPHEIGVGIAFLFDKTSGYDADWLTVPNPQVWQGIGTSTYPMGDGVDLFASGSVFYPAGAYYRADNNNTYMIIRQLAWNPSSGVFSGQLAWQGWLGQDPYRDMDIGNSNNYFWMFGCGNATAQFFRVDSASWSKDQNATVTGLSTGSTCFIETESDLLSIGTICDGATCTSYDLDAVLETISVSSTQDWTDENFARVDTRDGWLIAPRTDFGIYLHDFSDDSFSEELTSDLVIDADMVMDGSTMFLAAIVDDGAGERTVELHHGTPGSLQTAVFDFDDPEGGRDLDPESLSLHVDATRVLLAVSGVNALDPGNRTDAVGWAFLAR